MQITLDRELNGHKLHPETRIYAAVNASAEYSVNELDPAQADRFWTIDLEPTVEDWLNWANGAGVDSVIIDFIRQHPGHLRHKGQQEPGKVYPSQRSWDRLAQSLRHARMDLTELAGNVPGHLYPICLGFVGVEAAISLRDFVQNYDSVISAEDILNNWKKVKDKVGRLNADKQNAITDKLLVHCKGNTWTDTQVTNATTFIRSTSAEQTVAFFNKVMETNNTANIRAIHKVLGPELLKAITAAGVGKR
jgi:hypothetical protein